jgi:hypothetical protein
MPTLYVANCTDQQQKFFYRPDFNSPGSAPRLQDIPAGKQRLIYAKDAPMEAVENIVKQATRHGMIGVVELNRMPQRSVIPYVFNVDKPVPESAIRAVRDHNKGVKTLDGKDRRKAAAIAASSFVDTGVFEVAVKTEANDTEAPNLDEAVIVSEDGGPVLTPTETRRGPGRPRKAA